jgi:predicted phosphodiesterase
LEDAGAVDEIVFLGDIVGFGPHPGECIDLLAEVSPIAILGNHDESILSMTPGSPSSSWDQWARDRITDSQTAYLKALPRERSLPFGQQVAKLRHLVPGAPYLHPDMPDQVLRDCIAAIPDQFLVCGHSHRAIDRTLGARRLVCLPAVGQPRNRDPRAGYAIEVDGDLRFHFVAYDVERVVADINAIGLDETFRQRWVRFLRTGYDPDWSRDYVPQGR